MKVAILMLSYERYDTLAKVLPHNLANAGCEVDLLVLEQGSKDPRVEKFLLDLPSHTGNLKFKYIYTSPENVGISAGFNFLMAKAFEAGYTHFQFMANDILEPVDWIYEKAYAIVRIPNSGMVSIALGDHGYCSRRVNGEWINPGHVIGQFMISRAAYEALGALREDFGKYGPIDLDYNIRCERLGLLNYYLPLLRAVHLDDHNNELYGYDKAKQVEASWPGYVESLSKYEDPANCHIPNGEYLINVEQYHVQ